MDFRHALTWLNDTTVKWVLLLVGGILLKRWTPFVNKSIGVTLTVFSSVTALLHSMFPAQVPAGTLPSSFAFSSVAGLQLYAASSPVAQSASWAWNTLAPLAFAIASHSGPKNALEWLRSGVGFFWPGGKPPR